MKNTFFRLTGALLLCILILSACIIKDEVTPEQQTQSNQEKYDTLLDEYKEIQAEYKKLLQTEAKIVLESLSIVIDQYYEKKGTYPESMEALVPEFISEKPTIFGVEDVQYHLSENQEEYQLIVEANPLGLMTECYTLYCWEGNNKEFTCELYIDRECLHSE
jgi:hypothetical protein